MSDIGIRAGGPRQFAPERARAARALNWRAAALSVAIAAIACALYAAMGIRPFAKSDVGLEHVDEIAVFCACVAAVFLPVRSGLRRLRLPAWLRFRIRVLRADLGNFFFIQHRHVDGFLVTGKNSGSHWLKFMLSAGIAAQHGLALPSHSTGQGAEAIIGHPSRKKRNDGTKLIGTTHTIPSALLRFVPFVRKPPIVVLVRAIDSAMLSNYTKWHAQYAAPLDEFVRGDPGGRRFVADIWWYVHFFNRWGAWAEADPARILVVRYEDLMASPATWVPRIAAHFRLGWDEAALAAALRFVGKDAIRARQDPNAGEIIVPDATARVAFSTTDRAFIAALLARYLQYDFGYGRA